MNGLLTCSSLKLLLCKLATVSYNTSYYMNVRYIHDQKGIKEISASAHLRGINLIYTFSLMFIFAFFDQWMYTKVFGKDIPLKNIFAKCCLTFAIFPG